MIAKRKRPRLSQAEKMERAQDALERARSGDVNSNYGPIYAGLMEKGIAPEDIDPRVNVLTFAAWPALGRHVKKGEHGVKIVNWIQIAGKLDPATGKETGGRSFPRTTSVFHISQTEPDEARELVTA